MRTVTGTSTSGPAPQYGEFKYNHGLNSAPILVFAKSESLSRDWAVSYTHLRAHET